MTVVECAGDGRARGHAHGEEARDLVREALERWRDASGSSARTLVTDTGLLSAIDSTMPDLTAELRGIAEGAAVSFLDIAAYNLMDEQWWFDQANTECGCSVLGVVAPQRVLLAQNMDLPAFMDGSQLILRLQPPQGPEALVLTAAGLIGLAGVNDAGVAICVNTLLMLRHDPNGLPVAAVLRGALRHTTRTDAVAFLNATRHASGQHYAVADPAGLESVECSAGNVVVAGCHRSPTLVHTNHPLVSTNVAPAAEGALRRQGRIANSHHRLTHLRTHADDVANPTDAEQLLADAPLCITQRSRSATQTFATVTFVAGYPPRARFRLGLPKNDSRLEPSWSTAMGEVAQ